MKTLSNILALALILLPVGSMANTFNKADTIQGVIERMNNDLITISQKNSNVAKTGVTGVQITENTRFKDLDSIFELKKGDQIRVEYTEDRGKVVAIEVSKLDSTRGQQQPPIGIY